MRSSQTLDLGERRSLHCMTAGKGADVVLIHGALATSHDWLSGPFDALAREFRVTAIDRPGHGFSLRPRLEGSPRAQARQIRDGLEALGISRATFVGHSLGGLVALALAEQFPSLVDSLVLVAPIAFPEVRLLEHTLLAPRAAPVLGPFLSGAAKVTIDAAMLDFVQRLMFSPHRVSEKWRASFPYDLVLDSETMVAEGEDMAAILPGSPEGTIMVSAIEAPTHILTGTRDMIVRPEQQARLVARLMPSARLTEVEGEGHMPHQCRPELIVEAVRGAVAQPQSSER